MGVRAKTQVCPSFVEGDIINHLYLVMAGKMHKYPVHCVENDENYWEPET